MTHETETGFGSGLRALLDRKSGTEEEHAPAPLVEKVVADVVVSLVAEPVDEEPAELTQLRCELEAALDRERRLKETLEHQVQTYERGREQENELALKIAELEQQRSQPSPELDALRSELDASRDRERQLETALGSEREAYELERAQHGELAARSTELEQELARLAQLKSDVEEQQLVLKIQRDQFEAERAELAEARATIVAEEARVTELASHIDSRSVELESADQERAQAGAHLAQQLAALAERERELKRERAAIDTVRQEQEARFLARENALRELDAATLRRQQQVAGREVALTGIAAEVERERARLRERDEELASRETTLEKKLEAREKMLANGESALAAWEQRLREQAERLDRERNGHSHASQEAFALLAELEQREQRVGDRESRLLEAEERLTSRTGELAKAGEELRLREARLLADVELREDKLDVRERNIAEREELIEFRERDLRDYVSDIQGVLGERSVA